MVSYSSKSQIVKDENGNEKKTNMKISINVRDICKKICVLAKVCYEEHKNKFNFFNYNLVNANFQARKTLGLRKGCVTE